MGSSIDEVTFVLNKVADEMSTVTLKSLSKHCSGGKKNALVQTKISNATFANGYGLRIRERDY